MNSIGLIVNKDKDKELLATKSVIEWSYRNNIKILMTEKVFLENNCIEIVEDITFYKNSEMVVVIGGDGTVLHHAEKIALNNIPMLGINCGTVGYLTVVDKKQIELTLDNVLKFEYKIAKHSFITSNINNEKFNSLNEISIKSNTNKIINISVYVDEVYIHTFRGDGILICSPTGSTAYNLSSGGPLIMNNANVTCITPICPHQLFAKPIIINGDSNIKIIADSLDSTLEVMSDGKLYGQYNNNLSIQINKSNFTLKVINPFEKSFYEILLKKLIDFKDN